MLSKTTQYAIRALVYIHIQNEKGSRPGYKEIANEAEAPEHFTAKILQNFTKHSLLESAKGRGGGFYFDPQKEELRLYEVIRLMEGETFFNHCIFGFRYCDDKYPCPLHNEFMKIWDDFAELAQNQTIQSLARKIKDQKAVMNRPE